MTESVLAGRIAAKQVPSGHLAVWWLGGSGFVLKTSGGLRIYIDPYLSESVREIFGVARAFPTPMEPEEVEADCVISTHWHEDHLDPATIPVVARCYKDARFVMPPSAMARALSWGVQRDRIVPLKHGESVDLKNVKITAVPARHEPNIPGWEVPDAMGVMIEADGITFYHSGDTEYDLRLRALKSWKPDVATYCINGVSGNMNAHEAALLAWQMNAGIAIPHHHYLWADQPEAGEATLNPHLFEETYYKLGGVGRIILPEVGKEMEFAGRDLSPSHPGQNFLRSLPEDPLSVKRQSPACKQA